MLDHVTTAVQSPFSYASDPSGTELRKALLRADCDVVSVEPPTVEPLRVDSAQLLVGAVAGLTLIAGVARVAVS
jgi:hypothetical protein